MNKAAKIKNCTLGELMIYQIALSIVDGILAFHGFGSPLVQLALHLAKRNHAPNLVLVAGATYGINPTPAFLTPTTNDFAMNRVAGDDVAFAVLHEDTVVSRPADRVLGQRGVVGQKVHAVCPAV